MSDISIISFSSFPKMDSNEFFSEPDMSGVNSQSFSTLPSQND